MKKQIIIYALALSLLAVGLKLVEYRFLVLRHSFEVYGSIIALVFAGLGIYGGSRLTAKKRLIIEKEVIVEREVLVEVPSPALVVTSSNSEKPMSYPIETGLSKRELEILMLLSRGLSNQEIADQAFVSVSTVKTHISNLFLKLDVSRRTQAVNKARELGLIS
ncbi:MAG: response regulator transcription factor [Sphingobacteriales bacterium]|nr:MAG: response regulator transcription factor [Sphingobacteriales bacterium]